MPTVPPISADTLAPIVEHFARFDEAGTLSDGDGLTISYSRSLLDSSGIASITTSDATMRRTHSFILEAIYDAARRPLGSRISLDWGGQDCCTSSVVANLIEYVVTPSEYSAIVNSATVNRVERHQSSHGTLIAREGRTFYFLRKASSTRFGLGALPENWDGADAVARLVHDGPVWLLFDVSEAAIRYRIGDEWSYTFPDIYSVWGITGPSPDDLHDDHTIQVTFGQQGTTLGANAA